MFVTVPHRLFFFLHEASLAHGPGTISSHAFSIHSDSTQRNLPLFGLFQLEKVFVRKKGDIFLSLFKNLSPFVPGVYEKEPFHLAVGTPTCARRAQLSSSERRGGDSSKNRGGDDKTTRLGGQQVGAGRSRSRVRQILAATLAWHSGGRSQEEGACRLPVAACALLRGPCLLGH